MITEIPQYALRAYALFYTKYGQSQTFRQSELDWIVSESMKKKIFALLLNSGWLEKKSRAEYACVPPEKVMGGLLEFKVPEIMKQAEKPYAFTGLSAIEIWSDYSYVQRGIEKSPYFVKVLKKDIRYWKQFLNSNNIPNYIKQGASIGEYVILMPVESLSYEIKDDLKVEKLKEALKEAKANETYLYAYNYMVSKYGAAAG
jgi:hypothetical protein